VKLDVSDFSIYPSSCIILLGCFLDLGFELYSMNTLVNVEMNLEFRLMHKV